MPQLDKFIFFPQLFWLLLVLAALYLLLVGWALPRLLRSLKFRRVHRGRLGRQTGRSARLLLQLLPPLVALGQRPVALAPTGLDRIAGSLVGSLALLRRSLLPPLPLRPVSAPFPSGSGVSPFPLSPLPPADPQLPLSAPRLLPVLYYGRGAVLPPPPPLRPLPPPLLPSWADALPPLQPAPALLLLSLAARQTHRELLLWLDPFAAPSPLEELALSPLRRSVRAPLTYLPPLS